MEEELTVDDLKELYKNTYKEYKVIHITMLAYALEGIADRLIWDNGVTRAEIKAIEELADAEFEADRE